MAQVEKRTVSLSTDQAAYIDGLVASGGYASASEVVRDGLRALQARNDAEERWLREEVAPVYDRIAKDAQSGHDAKDVFAAIRQNLENRRSKSA